MRRLCDACRLHWHHFRSRFHGPPALGVLPIVPRHGPAEARKLRQHSGKKPEGPLQDPLPRDPEQLARRVELAVDPVVQIPELPDGAPVRVDLPVEGDVVTGLSATSSSSPE